MQASPEQPIHSGSPLQLLMFVDNRLSSGEQIRQIRNCLDDLKAQYTFELQFIDVGEQPYLAEQFKLVATPALIKIHPEPRHTLAGSDLVKQLMNWWPRWQRSVEEYVSQQKVQVSQTDDATAAKSQTLPSPPISSIAHSTELIRLSDDIFRLKQEKEELQEQLQFKDRIIAMLAHDLRNPLTATSIALETLELGNNPKEDGTSRLTPALTAQLLKHARTQTRAIDRMITDILQAAQGSNTDFRLQPQQLALGALCQDILEHLQEQFEAKAQRVETDIPNDLPLVYADQERIRQVITNLLDNAIKYTHRGGTIHLSILHRTAQKVQVSICDNGPGIPEENRELVFEDRFRLKRDEAEKGYGIGLSLCQRIVRAHYGQIWVDATPKEGSCFHFTLPVFRL